MRNGIVEDNGMIEDEEESIEERKKMIVKEDIIKKEIINRWLRKKSDGSVGERIEEREENGEGMNRMRSGDGKVWIENGGGGDKEEKKKNIRFEKEEGRVKKKKIRKIEKLKGEDIMRNEMRDRRIDSIFGNIKEGEVIVVERNIVRKDEEMFINIVWSMKEEDDNLKKKENRMDVGGNDREGENVVKNILRRNSLIEDEDLGKGDIIRDWRRKVMEENKNVEMLRNSVESVGKGRVGRRRKKVRILEKEDDIGRVKKERKLSMERVDSE